MYSLQFHKVAFFKLLLTFVVASAIIGAALSDDANIDNEVARLKILPTGVIYDSEDKAGKSIDYFHYSQEFADVQELIDNNGLKKVALFCAKGVFVLYNHVYHISHSDDDIMIFAGTDQCVNPGATRSLLYTEGYINPMTSTLTIFADERFTTPHYIINRQDEHDIQGIQRFGTVKSFILMGKEPWTVTTTKSTYCLKAESDVEFPVCPVAYSVNVFKEPIGWISARRGCNTTFDTEISLKYCFNHGSGNLEPATDGSAPPPTTSEGAGDGISVMPSPSTSVSTSGPNGIFSNCDNHEEFAMLLRIRLTQDFLNLYQVQFPLNKKHAWRTEILDNTMEIVKSSQPGEFLSVELLLFIRELYIYFAEKWAWSKAKGWPSAMPTQRVQLLGYETTRCLAKLREMGWMQTTAQSTRNFFSSMEKPEFKEDDIEPVFRPISGYDTVMEFVWLAINFVGVTCHGALEFENDFWMEYMNIAYNMYLHPMRGFWANPGVTLQYYPIILGGYNITRQLKVLAAATTILYKVTPINRLARPDSLAEFKAEAR
ncbi:unnamed protein product [Orchesella dallaii]|uniref:Uncharacterized protein n=1 Tax=Orchesella dallaii TaxID=48710 RepID=A0ABP1RX64_9HEXA